MDLRGLLFQLRSEIFNLLLLFLHFGVLFEELVEQHRVHCFISHGVYLPIGVACHQIWVYPLDLLGHEAELRDTIRIKLVFVAEGDGLER